jgi:hypothetical protein
MDVHFTPEIPGDSRATVQAIVDPSSSGTKADVTVPGPTHPSGADPAIVKSGPIKVETAGGTSADSPSGFVLLT